jgi:uncharacterized membrane-anchored protein
MDTAGRQGMRFNFEHPLREELHNELHARPSLYFEGDTDVWHVAIVGEDRPPTVPKVLADLKEVSTTQHGKHGIGRFAGGRLKWELHAEFLTLTFVAQPTEAAGDAPLEALHALCNLADGQVIAAVRVLVRDEKDGKCLEKPQADYVASEVGVATRRCTRISASAKTGSLRS